MRVTDKSLNGEARNKYGKKCYEVTTSDASVARIAHSYSNSSSYVIPLEAKRKGTATVVIKNGITGKTVAKIKVTI